MVNSFIEIMKINKILVDGQGWVYSTDGDIEPYEVNGEMALLTWYRQKNKNGEVKTFNGKYVVMIEYFADNPTTAIK